MQSPTDLTRDVLKFLADLAKTAQQSNLPLSYKVTRELLAGMFAPAHPKADVTRTISRLKVRGYLQEDDAGIRLTARGIERAQSYELEGLSIPRQEPWDGRWRLILWDIPEAQRPVRDQLRYLFTKLGLYQVRRSMWVTPYPCREQVEYLKSTLDLEANLLFLEATYLDGSAALRRHFNVRSPQES